MPPGMVRYPPSCSSVEQLTRFASRRLGGLFASPCRHGESSLTHEEPRSISAPEEAVHQERSSCHPWGSSAARSELNPTTGLTLPAVRGRRDRIASPTEAAALIAALPSEHDRAVWAMAFYAGLRLGELQALREDDVDLAAGAIYVRCSWDKKEGLIEPKSRAGVRKVPIVSALRGHIAAHRLARGESGGLFFGEGGQPFNRDSVVKRAEKAWKAAGLKPIGLHEARHSCASIFIAAGVNIKALSTYLGHSSITITLDRYGHLFPGNEDEAVGLVDGYLEREIGTEAARVV
jgi:integrase